MAKPNPTANPAVSLDQWSDGKAPDASVLTGNQADHWQNGNLGAQQAHYAEGDFVPFRAILTGLQEGITYTLTIQWDTTQGGKHAYDYIGAYGYSFPPSPTKTHSPETTPNPID